MILYLIFCITIKPSPKAHCIYYILCTMPYIL